MDQFVEVTPSQLAGVVGADGTKIISPEAQDVLDRLKAHYQSLAKPSAAQNYGRHLKSFFAWAERNGYSIRSLPADSVESFLSALGAAGQKESTLYVMRTQLKSALRECHNALGVDFAHLEYQTGKPREVRRAQKEREKLKRAEKRVAMTMAQAAAIEAARASGMPNIPAPYTPPGPKVDISPVLESIAGVTDPTELPMSTPSTPETTGATPAGAAAPQQQQPVVVVQMPPQQAQRATTTIGQQKTAGNQAATTTVGRGMTINSHTFTGPYVRISRMADGTDPLTPPGTETYITTVPLTQLLPHGDVAAYLQSFVMPNLRLPMTVSQVHFIFNELNDRRQPTGRRDELVVSMPFGAAGNSLGSASMANGQISTGVGTNVNGLPMGYNSGNGGLNGLPMGGGDRATDYLLRKLDEEASQARRRAEELQEKLRSEKDAQTTFLLMQQFQKEQDLRRELEDRKAKELDKMREPPPPPPPMFPPSMFLPPPPPPAPEPRIDSSTEMVKALAENQAKMMEAMLNGMKPQPPPPQKDSMEVMLPFISAMNQQMMSQQQANQQMLIQIQQANQQFMQALLTRENPVEKMLLAQIQEVKASANAPKEDEMESFANKLQKMKMVSDMLGGGGSAPSLIGELLANAEAIGEGAAKIIAASKSKVVLPTQPAAPQIAGTPTAGALPPGQPPPVPEIVKTKLDELEAAATKKDDQEIVTAVVDLIRGYVESPEPFNRIGQRFLNAFRDMEDPEEMYVFAKTIFTVVSRKPSKEVVKIVAETLIKWYGVIHEQVFGTAKALGGTVETAETGESDEAAEATEDDGSGEVIVDEGGGESAEVSA